MLAIKQLLPRPSRRGFLAGSAAAGLTLGFSPAAGPDRQRRRGRAEPVRGLSEHRAGQQRHRAVGAHGHGPGHLHRHRHAGGRGAGRRLGADAGRGCRRQSQVLRQHDVGRGRAGHRRLDRHPELVGPLPAGGGRRPRDAGPGSRRDLDRAGRRGRGSRTASSPTPAGGRRASASWRRRRPSSPRQRSRC